MQLPYDTRSQARSAQPVSLRGTADGSGNCTLTSKPVPTGARWRINYVTVTATGANTATFDLYVDSATPANVLDGTADANAAVAFYNPPRILDQGQVLVGAFAAASAGASCSMRIEYDVEAAD